MLKDIVIKYAEGKKYFSIEMLKMYLTSQNHDFASQTVKQNLNTLTKEKKIFNAGRSWYSTISESYQLDTEPVDDFIQVLSNQFPFLPFCCWSTGQLRAHAHHMLTRFVLFLYAEKDLLTDIFDYLRITHYETFLNPTQKEARKLFNIEEKTVVIRPNISRQPVDNHYATIEKILVDLLIELERLWIMDKNEYQIIFKNITIKNRINISSLLEYGNRRKVKKEIENMLSIPMPL